MGTTADNILFDFEGSLAEKPVILCGRFDIIHDPEEADLGVYAPVIANIECNGFVPKMIGTASVPKLQLTFGKFPLNQYDELLSLTVNINQKATKALSTEGYVQFFAIKALMGSLQTGGDIEDGVKILIRDYKDEAMASGLEGVGVIVKATLKTTSMFRGCTTYRDDD